MTVRLLACAYFCLMAVGCVTRSNQFTPAAAARPAIDASLCVSVRTQGSVTNLSVGQPLIVQLERNPPTRQRWTIANWNRGVLVKDGRPVSTEFRREGELVGLDTWSFRAARPGHQLLQFKLGVSSSPSAPAVRAFSLDVNVR
jgi:predicted secreted protein